MNNYNVHLKLVCYVSYIFFIKIFFKCHATLSKLFQTIEKWETSQFFVASIVLIPKPKRQYIKVTIDPTYKATNTSNKITNIYPEETWLWRQSEFIPGVEGWISLKKKSIKINNTFHYIKLKGKEHLILWQGTKKMTPTFSACHSHL